jgi:hypothetical protein
VLQPIIVTPDPQGEALYRLIAGERRYTSCLELGHSTIPTRLLASLSATEASIIELEENIKRQNLVWQDIVRAVGQIHRLYQSLDPDQTLVETGESIGMAKGTISLYLRVEEFLSDERIAACGTVREAYNILIRRDQRRAGEALQDLIDFVPGAAGDGVAFMDELMGEASKAPGWDQPESDGFITIPPARPPASNGAAVPDPAKTILHESFLQWAPRYTGRKFSLVHCDFPYGVNLFAAGAGEGQARSPQGGGRSADGQDYDDSKELFIRLLDCLLEHRDKFMSVSSHLMFWYSEKHRSLILEKFRTLAPELVIWTFPLIWTKSDNTGIAQDVRRGPRHAYETCLLATRGNRNIVQVVADWYSAPTDRRWHPSTKPEPMLRHFMRMLVDEHTELLDPTCGSGSALRAAESLGARHCLGMDADENTVGMARVALRQARALRVQSGGTVA